jgi:hypothetical protein
MRVTFVSLIGFFFFAKQTCGTQRILLNNRAEFNAYLLNFAQSSTHIYLTSRTSTACHLSLTTSPRANLALLLREHPGDYDSCYCFRIQKFDITQQCLCTTKDEKDADVCPPSSTKEQSLSLTAPPHPWDSLSYSRMYC